MSFLLLSTLTSAVSIRAYGAQDAFRKESYRRIENYTRSNRMFWNLNRWISTRSDVLGAVFSSGLGLYMVYGPGVSTIDASNVGFSLAMAGKHNFYHRLRPALTPFQLLSAA